MRDTLSRNVVFTEVSESLDHETAQASRGGHVARCRAPKLNRHRADPYEAARAVGQKHYFHGHLL